MTQEELLREIIHNRAQIARLERKAKNASTPLRASESKGPRLYCIVPIGIEDFEKVVWDGQRFSR